MAKSSRSAAKPRTVSWPRKPFVDVRGEILNLVDGRFGSALIMRSVKGSVRGNHYHKSDFHYCWLQSGGLVYYYRRYGDRRIRKVAIKPGQLFYTPPRYEHAMKFTKDSVVFCCARNSRTRLHYERDTVRASQLVT
jgi:dTDP-4-dehydrorhamnose 3,5-epimerase-like enzyme